MKKFMILFLVFHISNISFGLISNEVNSKTKDDFLNYIHTQYPSQVFKLKQAKFTDYNAYGTGGSEPVAGPLLHLYGGYKYIEFTVEDEREIEFLAYGKNSRKNTYDFIDKYKNSVIQMMQEYINDNYQSIGKVTRSFLVYDQSELQIRIILNSSLEDARLLLTEEIIKETWKIIFDQEPNPLFKLDKPLNVAVVYEAVDGNTEDIVTVYRFGEPFDHDGEFYTKEEFELQAWYFFQ